MVDFASELLEAALDYAARGWSAIPIEQKGKRPLVRWERFEHTCPDTALLRRWFRRWPEANIGVVTGVVSGLLVLDVDPEHGGSGSLQDLERRHGDLPATIEAVSGGGGRHLYFEHPGGIVSNRTGIAPGIDLRGDGGVIVAPPSLHSSGRQYRWRASHGPNDERLASMPNWLLAMIRGDAFRPGHPLAYWRALVQRGVAEGERNSTIASLTGHLLWHGVDPKVALELLLCWNRTRCAPPLDDDEVARVVESVGRTHARSVAEAQARSRSSSIPS